MSKDTRIGLIAVGVLAILLVVIFINERRSDETAGVDPAGHYFNSGTSGGDAITTTDDDPIVDGGTMNTTPGGQDGPPIFMADGHGEPGEVDPQLDVNEYLEGNEYIPQDPVIVDPVVQSAERIHIVVAGDSLWKIAEKYYGSGARKDRIFEANRDQLEAETTTLRLGMKLRVPADQRTATIRTDPEPVVVVPAGADAYTVKKGDTLWTIAQELYGDGGKYLQIFEANKTQLKSKDDLKIGQKLIIPR